MSHEERCERLKELNLFLTALTEGVVMGDVDAIQEALVELEMRVATWADNE